MNTQTNYTIVGFFVVILTAAFILSIVWLSSGFSFEEYAHYQINMEESVSGLSIDSAVEFNGVNVGKVSLIELNHHNPHLVEIIIKVKKNTPITNGTFATLTTRGLTGLVYVALQDDGSNLKHLTTIKPGAKFPIIRTAPSIFMRIDDAFTELNESLQELSTSVRSVLDRENQKNIKYTLNSLRQVTQELIPLVKTTQTTLNQFQTQLLPMTYNLFSNLNTSSQQLTELTTQIQQNPSVLIRGSTPAPPGPGERP